MNPSYEIAIWLMIGALVGWIGNKIMGPDARYGGGAKISVGMLGAGVGGYLARILGDASSTDGLLMSLLVAFGGACLAMLAWTTLTLRRASAR